MSRTYKDAPYKIREKRLGIPSREEKCSLCADAPDRTITTGFTAIFFAHEVREIEAFQELATEQGYSLDLREVSGYLGDIPVEDRFVSRYSRRKSVFEGYLDPKRAIYSIPRGVAANLLWTGEGRFTAREEPEQDFSSLFGGDDTYFKSFLNPVRRVSSKKNIFEVISISKVTEIPGYSYHYHGADGLSYLLNGHCHCGSCQPDESGSKGRLRTVTSELRKAFNAGNYDAMDEIADELIRSSSVGYRDPMNC